MNVTFLGLGIMGSRMARHILATDHRLTVWNRSPEPVRDLVDAGAASADSITGAVSEADLVLSMLATPEVVRSVVLEGGVLEAMQEGAIWADASTVGPAFAGESAAAARQAGVRYLGVPVSGTREPAEQGTLKVLVGGDGQTLEECRDVLAAYSDGIVHVGMEPDRGAVYKILINNLLAQSMAAFSETVRLGEALGLSHDFLLDNLPGLPVIAPFVKSKVEKMRSGDYSDASFPLELMHKDVNLVVEAAFAANSPVPQAATGREIYGRAKAAGLGRDDFSAVHG
ncbi:NAD(P)-dependent oxidoreductase [Lewinella sp. IMCC34183]|uniref:NAD(P)-dependent oxidoreductase n=1 Tax=Lewinella sp. IMCC34183 TaxID=2248762 RepID=UPI000E24F682|nr:NAD(P)-dependent oxidoreductase [Lewinella sp. IMCC34183]